MTPLEVLAKLSQKQNQTGESPEEQTLRLFNENIDNIFSPMFECGAVMLRERGFDVRIDRAPKFLCLICNFQGENREIYVTLCLDGTTVYVDHLGNISLPSYRSETNKTLIIQFCERMVSE